MFDKTMQKFQIFIQLTKKGSVLERNEMSTLRSYVNIFLSCWDQFLAILVELETAGKNLNSTYGFYGLNPLPQKLKN